MSKVHLILESSLFSNSNFRTQLKQFVESQLTVEFEKKIDLVNIDVSLVFDKDYQLKEEVAIAIRNAKVYINFEHFAADKVLQNLIFLFLIYSHEKFPNQESWSLFIIDKKEVQYQLIESGISELWLKFQNSLMNTNLKTEIVSNKKNGMNNLDFEFADDGLPF